MPDFYKLGETLPILLSIPGRIVYLALMGPKKEVLIEFKSSRRIEKMLDKMDLRSKGTIHYSLYREYRRRINCKIEYLAPPVSQEDVRYKPSGLIGEPRVYQEISLVDILKGEVILQLSGFEEIIEFVSSRKLDLRSDSEMKKACYLLYREKYDVKVRERYEDNLTPQDRLYIDSEMRTGPIWRPHLG